MESQTICVSCRLQNKIICYSTSPNSQYCSDFKLFSLSTMIPENMQNEALGKLSAQKNAPEWAFQDNIPSEIQYEEDILAGGCGYSSRSGMTESSRAAPTAEQPEGPESIWCDEYADAPASVEPNHGSLYDDGMMDIADVKQRKSRRVSDSSSSWPSLLDGPVTSPTSLETWKQSPHRHESLAYRLSRPAKKRRSGKH